MQILALNCGSSTLKFGLIDMRDAYQPLGQEQHLASGILDSIGARGSIRITVKDGAVLHYILPAATHGEATGQVIGRLRSLDLLPAAGPDAVAHRVVHGGYRFASPILISSQVISEIEALSHLAPLHNGPALNAIRTAQEVLGPAVPQVAVFDTAFHTTLPTHAATYAIPLELARRHHVRRYGFHGLAHRYMAERYAMIPGLPREQVTIVTLQLGSGCSATAIKAGQSVDTSMGFTPLEGLMMGTRSGDLDPLLPGFLARQEGVDLSQVEEWLSTSSGLLGVSGRFQDMRSLLDAESAGDEQAALAVDMFCYRVRKYIGAYLAALGGARALIFGGGIGENLPSVRARVCAGMDWCGLALDEERNASAIGIEASIGSQHSQIQTYVIPVNEEAIIARDAAICLAHG